MTLSNENLLPLGESTVFFSLIQLEFLQCSFHQSRVYFSSELFLINPISVCAISANHYFFHFNFYLHKDLV